jgi:hypothetical protein
MSPHLKLANPVPLFCSPQSLSCSVPDPGQQNKQYPKNMNEFFHRPTFVMLFEGHPNLFLGFAADNVMVLAGGME